MANKNVFKSASKGKTVPPATHVNNAGGIAYKLGEKAALAQYAATGTFNDSFYTKGEDQAAQVLAIAAKIDPTFIGKVALYSREQGRMKDMPALLAAHLSTRGAEGLEVLKAIFPVVIDNSRMLRNFVQMMRSGAVGRKSLGTRPKKLVQTWFNSRTTDAIFKQSTGNDPSMADCMRLCHLDDQKSPERMALYAYIQERTKDNDKYNESFLPAIVREYEAFKKAAGQKEHEKLALPKVPWEMLVGLPLSDAQWSTLAQQASWTQIRMNLNTFSRHGVFKEDGIARTIAGKIKDVELIKRAKPFPYQLLTTYLHTSESGEEAVPRVVRDALHDALDVATETVPSIDGPAHALIDVSGSMGSAVSGHRAGATSKATCVQVAALIGSAFLRKNRESMIIPYSDNVFLDHGCEARDSVMTNANKLAKLGGGGTNLGAAFTHLNKVKAKGDLVIVASDMETWMDTSVPHHRWGGIADGTVSASAWAEYKSRNPKAKLVCINLQAADHCQVANNTDVLNIGGFSDTLWEVIKSFVEGMPSADHWVSVIEAIALPAKAN